MYLTCIPIFIIIVIDARSGAVLARDSHTYLCVYLHFIFLANPDEADV